MRPWFLMFGSMLVWAVHFGGVYAIASVFDLISASNGLGSRIATGALTFVCAATDVALLAAILVYRRASDRDPVIGWMMGVGILLAAVSLISVLWQGLPALLG